MFKLRKKPAQSQGEPLYELILRWTAKRLHMPRFLSGAFLGLSPLAVGLVLAYLNGTVIEFLVVSLRLVYWAVILSAFWIMHTIYEVWKDNSHHIRRLVPDGTSAAASFTVFENIGCQLLCATVVAAIVAYYYFTLRPSISSQFVFWYVFAALMGAAIAASFGVYFSLALLHMVRHLSLQEELNVFQLSPATTPGILALNYVCNLWGIAYSLELLIILYGIVAGPWGTTVKTYRLTLAGGAGVISLWTLAHFFYCHYRIHRMIQREKLRSLEILQSEAAACSMGGRVANVSEDSLRALDYLASSPSIAFGPWWLLRSSFLAALPWLVVTLSRLAFTRELGKFLLTQFGLR